MEIDFTRLHKLYTSMLVRTVRTIMLFFILAGFYAGIAQSYFPKYAVFFLIWFFIIEVFIHFKIGKVLPKTTVQENTGDLTRSSTMHVLRLYLVSRDGGEMILKLESLPQVTFLLERMGITKEQVKSTAMTKDELLSSAAEIVKKINGKFITPTDLISAYLLKTEDTTRLLFTQELKKEDFLQIVQWTRSEWDVENSKSKAHTGGGGLGEGLITGWTPETLKYTEDITYRAFKDDPQITGREEEFRKMIESLQKTNNNNILLSGEIGSGKENLVELLAVKSQQEELPDILCRKKIIELRIGPLIAGVADKGELEQRIEAVVGEVSHAGNVILYIPEFQNILGGASYSIDLSGVLLPYLKNGQLPIIATMTKGNYKAFFERNSLKEAFEVISLDEPSIISATQMLFHRTSAIERKYQCILTFNAVVQAVKLADRYFPDNSLPGSAVTLLEDVANTVSVSGIEYFARTKKKLVTSIHVIKQIQDKTHIATGAPTKEEKDLLLHLEEKLHQRIIGQKEAVTVISEAIRRLRSGLTSSKKPISFLFLGPTGVGKTETAKALGDIYFGGEESILRLDMSEYTDENGVKRLLGAPPGEGEERGELTDKIHDHPASLVLLDEFEKAHPLIRDLFLQVLEDGRLTDNKGRTVSFLNAMVIATSNAGAEFIREQLISGVQPDKVFKHKLLDYLQEKNVFRPELLNRFDDVIVFSPLGKEEVQQIINLLLQKLTATLAEQDIIASFDQKVVEKIATDGADVTFGARPLQRYIQDTIEDQIAQLKLADRVGRGDKIRVTLNEDGKVIVKKEVTV